MGGSNESKWFDSMVVRKVEKGDKVLFWCNRWVGQQSLANEFPRLYLNSLQKEECIINMGEWAEGVWRWNFRWHRDWFVWEREVPADVLQYADDTIFFGEASMENVKTVKVILRSFELVSGLRINFAKSK